MYYGWVRRGARVKYFRIIPHYITVPRADSPTAILKWLGMRNVSVTLGRPCWYTFKKPCGSKLLTRCKYYKCVLCFDEHLFLQLNNSVNAGRVFAEKSDTL